MPYISDKEGVRRYFEEGLKHIRAMNAGELNYLFTRIIIMFLEKKGVSYQSINDVIGALEGAKAEFYRRVVINYEENKIIENGDVYPCQLIPTAVKRVALKKSKSTKSKRK